MSQSGFIAALLLAAFILFLAARNRLQTYAAVLWGATSKPIPHPAPPAVPGAGPLPNGGGGLGSLPGLGDALPLLEAAPEVLMLL